MTKRTLLLIALSATIGVPALAACSGTDRQAALPPQAAGASGTGGATVLPESGGGSEIPGAPGSGGSAMPTTGTVGANITPQPTPGGGGLRTRPDYDPGSVSSLFADPGPTTTYRTGTRAPWGLLLREQPEPVRIAVPAAPAPTAPAPAAAAPSRPAEVRPPMSILADAPAPGLGRGADGGAPSGTASTLTLAAPTLTQLVAAAPTSIVNGVEQPPTTTTAGSTDTSTPDTSTPDSTGQGTTGTGEGDQQSGHQQDGGSATDGQTAATPTGSGTASNGTPATQPSAPTQSPASQPTQPPPAPQPTPQSTPQHPTPQPTPPKHPQAKAWRLFGLDLGRAPAAAATGHQGSPAFHKALEASLAKRPEKPRPGAAALRSWSASLRKAATLAPDSSTKNQLQRLASYVDEMAKIPVAKRATLQHDQPKVIAMATDLRARLSRTYGVDLLG